MISPILEARAKIQKYFRSFFGSNENFKMCFRDLLTLVISNHRTAPDGVIISDLILEETNRKKFPQKNIFVVASYNCLPL